MALLSVGITKAQHSELGVFFGTSYYLGDLNPKNILTKQTLLEEYFIDTILIPDGL